MRQALGLRLAMFAVLVATPLGGASDSPAQAHSDRSIRLDQPCAYQVVQRDRDDRGDIVVAGRCLGFDGRLQVRWGDEPWTPVRAGRDGTFRACLRARRVGQETLEVRSLGHPACRVARRFVGIGDIYVIAGQSNASGRSRELSVYHHDTLRAGLFGNDDQWKQLADPVDSPVGQVDTVSRDRHGSGSVWPLVATELVAAEDVPVAFIPCARGNVTMERWLRDPTRPRSPRTLYGSILRRIRAVGGHVRAVLFWQGESDARWSVPPGAFEQRLRRFAATMRAAVGAPVVAAQIGDFSPARYPPESVDRIRAAQQRACDACVDLIPGPSLYDIDLDGSWHFSQPNVKAVAAHRWAAAILGGVLGRAAGTPPRLIAAEYDGGTGIDLRFRTGDEPLLGGPVGGFTVVAAGRRVGVVDATVRGTASVRLELAAPVAAPLTVSLGSGRSGAGAGVPVESSAWRLPALTFLDVRVASAAAQARVLPSGSP